MTLRRLLAAVPLLFAAVSPSSAQCADWNGPFHLDGPNGGVLASAVFDDGSGAKLYVGGYFTQAFGTPASHLAAWDGASWSSVGGGANGPVEALVVFDDGSGPALYLGGDFTQVGGVSAGGLARWDGAAWTQIGDISGSPLATVRALAVHNEGGVDKLFAAGTFTSIDGVPLSGVARWDGASWTPLGSGLAATSGYPWGFALASFDDGSGSALYVGGPFDSAGGVVGSPKLARWDGASWSGVGGGCGGTVFALCVYDDGGGARLFAGGQFISAGGAPAASIASWDGASLSALQDGLVGGGPACRTMHVFDDGGGEQLYCGGTFLYAANFGPPLIESASIARWNGSQWSGLGDGVPQWSPGEGVFALASFNGELCVGGAFQAAGDVLTKHFALFDDDAWRNAGAGRPLSSQVNAVLGVDDATLGSGVYAGGSFELTGSGAVAHIARWDGTEWLDVGGGVDNSVSAFATFDDGSGNALYVGGYFDNAGGVPANGIARWNGTSWSALGSGIDGALYAFATFDDGTGDALHAAGIFSSAGGVPVTCLAKWDGIVWSAVGDPLSFGGSSASVEVRDLAVFDDGSGIALYVGGKFDAAGATSVRNIARWNGVAWSHLSLPQLNGPVRALEVYDDGSGADLYAAGGFFKAGGITVRGIARWDGTAWSDLGAGVPGADGIEALCVHTDGNGSVLVAAGFFTEIDNVPAARIARWDGSSWSAFGSGVNDTVAALASIDDGHGPALFAAGSLTSAGGNESRYVARWSDPCACAATSYCTAGLTSNGCTPAISGSGTPSASATSGFTIVIANVEGAKAGHIFYGVTGPLANPWGPSSSSFLCVKAPTQRTPTQNSGGTHGACDGAMALDWNAFVAANPSSLGAPFSAGADVWAQLYFRDPPAPKTTNLSDGLQFTLCP